MKKKHYSIHTINALPVSIILLTLITATAHLYLGLQHDEELHTFFLINGFGYLFLLLAYFSPFLKKFHQSIQWTMLGYVLLTIVLWFFLGSPREGTLDPFDTTVKAVELVLAVHLGIDLLKSKVS